MTAPIHPAPEGVIGMPGLINDGNLSSALGGSGYRVLNPVGHALHPFTATFDPCSNYFYPGYGVWASYAAYMQLGEDRARGYERQLGAAQAAMMAHVNAAARNARAAIEQSLADSQAQADALAAQALAAQREGEQAAALELAQAAATVAPLAESVPVRVVDNAPLPMPVPASLSDEERRAPSNAGSDAPVPSRAQQASGFGLPLGLGALLLVMLLSRKPGKKA